MFAKCCAVDTILWRRCTTPEQTMRAGFMKKPLRFPGAALGGRHRARQRRQAFRRKARHAKSRMIAPTVAEISVCRNPNTAMPRTPASCPPNKGAGNADENIGEDAVIGLGHALGDPAGDRADQQHGEKAYARLGKERLRLIHSRSPEVRAAITDSAGVAQPQTDAKQNTPARFARRICGRRATNDG